MCVYLYVRAITFELIDYKHRYLACWFTLTLSRPCLKYKAIGQSSRSQDKFVVRGFTLRRVTDCLIVKFFMLNWSVRLSGCKSSRQRRSVGQPALLGRAGHHSTVEKPVGWLWSDVI